METITNGGSRVVFLPAIRGLVDEGERVRRAIQENEPDAVAVSLGAEDLKALGSYAGGNEPAANWEEELYIAGLSQWGEVKKPPPCYVSAVSTARVMEIKLEPLDYDDEAYTERYIEFVTTWDLIGHSRLEKRAEKRQWVSQTPEDFVREFDEFVNDPEGYVLLEKSRERHIAKRLAKLSAKYPTVLAVVEFERAAGVRALLDDYLPTNSALFRSPTSVS